MKGAPIHTRRGKRRFIGELIKLVKRDIMRRVPDMPQEWDGFELREYIAMHFKENTLNHDSWDRRKRAREFKNYVFVSGL